MGFVADRVGQTIDQVGQPQVPAQGGKGGGQPQVPAQGGKGGVQQPTIPPQGGKGNMPLPEHYQSPYANYGFDSGLQSYLDNQYLGSMSDAGVNYQYDPTNQTFTGGTMTGRYNPIPLNVMQQVAGGDRSVLAPYFQSRFPQQPANPQIPKPTPGQVRPPNMPFYQNPNPGTYGAVNNNRVTAQTPSQPQPANPQRGLGALQTDKFRRRLG